MNDFETLTDAEVLERTRRLRARERANTTALIAHLVEVERRGLFAEAGYPSMFKYLVGALGYPEDAAYKRARVARLVRDVPVVIEYLADGRLHLSGALVLAPLLTSGNATALLARATGRSKRELERLVADLAPRPTLQTQVRRLPQPAPAASAPALPLDGPVSPRGGTSAEISPRGESAAERRTGVAPRREADSAVSPRGESVAENRSDVGLSHEADGLAVSPRGESLVRACAVEASPVRPGLDAPSVTSATEPIHGAAATGAPIVATRASAPAPRSLPAKMTPLGREQYRVAFTARESTVGKMRQLVALLSHQVPSGDLGECLDRALDVAIGRLERERFGSPRSQRPQPAKAKPASTELATTRPAPTEVAAQSPVASEPAPRSRHIAAATRRAVFERDGGRCAYVAPDGRRCAERGWLEIHHAGVPFALGGAHDVDNLALFCRAHNQWAGRKVFGERTARAPSNSS